MKRDMSLIRDILAAVEASDKSPLGWISLEFPDVNKEHVSYQVKLLEDAGLLVAQDLSSMGGFNYAPKRLTWEGHEFLDAIQADNVWNSVLERLKDVGGTAPLEVVKALAIEVAKGYLGLGPSN